MAMKSKAPPAKSTKGKAAPHTQQSSAARSQTKAKATAAPATKSTTLKPQSKPASAKPSAAKAVKPSVSKPVASKASDTQKAKAPMVAKTSAAAIKPVASKSTGKPAAKPALSVKPSATKAAPVAKAAAQPAKATAPSSKPQSMSPSPAKATAAQPAAHAPASKPAAAKKAAAQAAPSGPIANIQPSIPKVHVAPPAPVAPPKPAPVAQAPVSTEPKKAISARHGFKTGEWIVYPAHGVGKVVAIDEQEIAGMTLELFVIAFEKDKLTLRVPTGKAQSVGMRKLAEEGHVARALDVLKGRARIKRTMWSRRAQEFDQKINSGDIIAIAEVVRDLFRADNQPEQSYSERQLFEAALDRMAREVAIVEKLDERGAVQRIMEVLQKSAKARKPADAAPADVEEGDDTDEATAAA